MVGEFIKNVGEWRVNVGENSAILLNLALTCLPNRLMPCACALVSGQWLSRSVLLSGRYVVTVAREFNGFIKTVVAH